MLRSLPSMPGLWSALQGRRRLGVDQFMPQVWTLGLPSSPSPPTAGLSPKPRAQLCALRDLRVQSREESWLKGLQS